MPFKPLTTERLEEVQRTVARLKKEIEIKQKSVDNLENYIRDGEWYRETKDTGYRSTFTQFSSEG